MIMAKIGSDLGVLSSRQCTGARTGCTVQDADWNSQIFTSYLGIQSLYEVQLGGKGRSLDR